MAFLLTVCLPKGGGAKTATAVNLAAGFARAGWRTLLVDTDAQGNASSNVGFEPDGGATLTRVLFDGAPAADARRSTAIEHLELIPAGDALGQADIKLSGEPAWERRLADALESIRDEYALVVIDTPPNLSTVVANACVAADGVLMPLTPEGEAFDAAKRLVAKLAEWRRYTRAPMPLLGVVRSRWDSRRKLDRKKQGEIAELPDLQAQLLETIIPDQTVVPQAYDAHVDVAAYAPASDAAAAYTALVAEVAGRISAQSQTMVVAGGVA